MAAEWIDEALATFEARLTVLGALLDKAEAQGTGRDLDVLAKTSLAPDMFSLGRQIEVASSQPLQFIEWLEGRGEAMPRPSFADLTWAEARAKLADSLAELANTRAKGISVHAEAKHIAIPPAGICLDLSARRYLNDWLVPNFYFHLVTAYAILRSQGVAIGKGDYLGHLAGDFRPIPQDTDA